MRIGSPLGFHGVVLPVRDPEAEARRWSAALGWPVLRRSRREVVLGKGPELFVAFVRASGSGEASIPELHLAVEELREAGRESDSMGGESVRREFSAARLCVREFSRPPDGRWRRASPGASRRVSRSRRSGRARARSK